MRKSHLNQSVREHISKPRSILYIDQTVGEAVLHLRKNKIYENAFYAYVIDQREKLLGVVSIRDLLISEPDTPLREIVKTKIKTISSNQTMLEAITLMQKFRLVALPVIEEGVFIGAINLQHYFHEQVELDSARKRFQVFQTLGMELEEGPYRGIACAIISVYFEAVLLKTILLAMFIPLVLSLSESISMQSMTQSLHDLPKQFNFWKQVREYIGEESKLYSLIALTSAIFVGLISLLWGDGIMPALVIGASIFCSIIVSAIFGALVPIFLSVWKLDPNIASGPIVLMFADILTTTVYLNLGLWWLS